MENLYTSDRVYTSDFWNSDRDRVAKCPKTDPVWTQALLEEAAARAALWSHFDLRSDEALPEPEPEAEGSDAGLMSLAALAPPARLAASPTTTATRASLGFGTQGVVV